jgi:Terminase large subunit, T4likevirus-type, N-terminal
VLAPHVIAEPLPGMQTLLLRCPCFEVFVGGARGPGKTYGMLLDWVSHQDEYGPLASGLMVRRTYKQLVDTIKEAKRVFIPIGARWIASGIDYGTFFFPNGASIRFRYLANDDDAEEYQGHQYTRIYVEELGTFPNPSPIFKLMATLRSKAGVRVGFRATGNPGGPGTSWIRARYVTPAPLGLKVINTEYKNPWTGQSITRDRVYIPGVVQQNPYLGADYIANLQMQASAKLVAAWLNGDWSAVEGAFFENFNTDLHVLRPFEIPGHWARFRGGDWGSAKPFSIGWYAVASEDRPLRKDDGKVAIIPRGAMVKYREWYGMEPGHFDVGVKMTVEAVADGMLAREMREPRGINGRSAVTDGVLDPACFAHTSGPSIAERFADKDIFWRPADNARTGRQGRMGGWDLMRHRLDGESGRPMLYFFDVCVDSIRTIPELQHDQAKSEDLDTESEDHAADECRYACASRPYVKRSHRSREDAISPANEHGTVKVDLEKAFLESERAQVRTVRRI